MSKKNVFIAICCILLLISVLFNLKLTSDINKAYRDIDRTISLQMMSVKENVAKAELLFEKKHDSVEDLKSIGTFLDKSCYTTLKEINQHHKNIGKYYADIDLFEFETFIKDLSNLDSSLSSNELNEKCQKISKIFKAWDNIKVSDYYDYKEDKDHQINDIKIIEELSE